MKGVMSDVMVIGVIVVSEICGFVFVVSVLR